MYMYNPEELRSIHEERVGVLKNLYSKSDKEARDNSYIKNIVDMMLRKRNTNDNK